MHPAGVPPNRVRPAPGTPRHGDNEDDDALAELDELLARVEGLRGEHQREWIQFAVWATAHQHPVLPAPAAVLAAYLDAYPGTLATQRGRATAITAAHRAACRTPGDPLPITTGPVPPRGLPSPADAETIRRLLRPGRAARLAAARAEIEPAIAALPTHGWPDALHGRRDALVLHLVVAGLSWDTIAALCQRDICLTGTAVAVGTQPLITLPATGHPATCPVAVMRRWAAVLAHAPRATGHITLEPLLTTPPPGAEPEIGLLPEWADQPLLCGFDERGFAEGVIDELNPLTRSHIIEIYTSREALTPPPAGIELSTDWHERGIAARHRDHAAGHDLDDLLTRLETMLDDLHTRTQPSHH
ncbi:hypothetical protein [Nocardia asteroides]|uniref:hypothetical protein n=1 Tax=Nocardia asteroides TaxID=1824 RepID=UPI001E5B532D|nr:hypothetical protein [Nocardia asteroides]UGT61807.1 hypothetical protein LTT61_00150 [Nocardia asteroides]